MNTPSRINTVPLQTSYRDWNQRVLITKMFNGLFSMQVCAVDDATDEEILEKCNIENPAGTTNGWCTVLRDDSKDTEERKLAPVACAQCAGRKHFVIFC